MTGQPRPNDTARAQVSAVVHALSRARWKQIFVDCLSTAVFFAIVLSIVVVIVIRLGWLPISPSLAVFALLTVAVVIASIIAAQRRPDDLEVAIDADLKLHLMQRLSTAWEFIRDESKTGVSSHNDEVDDTSGRLAAQAVKARLPARSRSAQVFALRANAFAVMTPIAIIMLTLVTIVDLDFSKRTAAAQSDEMVISEGVRLRDYGRRMQARARQRDLPRSAQQSARVQELGARMQSGALSRDEALSRLRDLDDALSRERRDALNQGEQTDVGPLAVQSMGEQPQPGGMSAQQMLRQILDGRLKPSDATSQMLSTDPSALSRRGISSEQLRDALERFEDGDRKALEEVMERMSRSNQGPRDANELRNARDQVALARESLGDRNSRPTDERLSTAGVARKGSQGTPSKEERGAQTSLDDDVGEDGSSMPGGRGNDRQREREPRLPDTELAVNEDGAVLKAEGQLRDGGVFVSEARVLPRAGNVTLDNSQISTQYSQQLEEVLSNEQYPLHYKEFIRRYFLNLSQGGRQPSRGSSSQ